MLDHEIEGKVELHQRGRSIVRRDLDLPSTCVDRRRGDRIQISQGNSCAIQHIHLGNDRLRHAKGAVIQRHRAGGDHGGLEGGVHRQSGSGSVRESASNRQIRKGDGLVISSRDPHEVGGEIRHGLNGLAHKRGERHGKSDVRVIPRVSAVIDTNIQIRDLGGRINAIDSVPQLIPGINRDRLDRPEMGVRR